MEITHEVVQYVANLSRLELSEDELIKFTEDFKSILGYVEMLNKLDTKDIKPTDHIFDIKNIFRDDSVSSSFDRDNILNNAPSKLNGCYFVPKVLE